MKKSMKTLFLGSFGFGNLGDELCLIEAMQAFPSTEAWAFSNDPDFTQKSVAGLKGFLPVVTPGRSELINLRPDRVVLGGGGVGFFPSIRDMLHWMYTLHREGAECHIHNIGVAHMKDLSWAKAPEVQNVLANLKSCSVRDDVSWFCIRGWPGAPKTTITYYPERNLTSDETLLNTLPKGRPLLGISITGQKQMRQALMANIEKITGELENFKKHLIVPIISTVSAEDPEEDDISGFMGFRDIFLSEYDVVCEDFLDRRWWRNNMTALGLRGVISALSCLMTQRKHNLIHAIGTGVPAIGIFPNEDDSIARIFFTLRGYMPSGSRQLSLNKLR